MKAISLKIGKKGARAAVNVPLQVAENPSDVLELVRGNESVLVRCFNRGWRIENQERSGARDAFGEGKTVEDIAGIVASYDPSAITPRTSGPRVPKTVKIEKGKSYSADDLRALLEAQGIKVTDENEVEANEGTQPVGE